MINFVECKKKKTEKQIVEDNKINSEEATKKPLIEIVETQDIPRIEEITEGEQTLIIDHQKKTIKEKPATCKTSGSEGKRDKKSVLKHITIKEIIPEDNGLGDNKNNENNNKTNNEQGDSKPHDNIDSQAKECAESTSSSTDKKKENGMFFIMFVPIDMTM